MNKESKNYFYCFSPLVMFTTFIIELGSALYILFKYRMDLTAKLIASMLMFLGLFQFAEYMVCQQAFFLSSLDWARVGHVAITILPPLGIHIGLTIAQKKNNHLLAAAYGSALIFSIFFLFIGSGLQSPQCLGNYVIFKMAPYAVLPYAVYYNGWLLIGIYLFTRARERIKDIKRKQALRWMAIGYLSFMIPTTVANIIDPRTIAGIPSIMCGFDIIMALCLAFKVAPLVLTLKSETTPAETT
jgi:hypothetical protein